MREEAELYEELVCDITHGQRMRPKWGFDVLSGKVRLEVKPSGLHNERWHWRDLLGPEWNRKEYDYLILVGDGSLNTGRFDLRLKEPFYFFNIPYAWVVDFVEKHGGRQDLNCSARYWNLVGETSWQVWQHYCEDLGERYLG